MTEIRRPGQAQPAIPPVRTGGPAPLPAAAAPAPAGPKLAQDGLPLQAGQLVAPSLEGVPALSKGQAIEAAPDDGLDSTSAPKALGDLTLVASGDFELRAHGEPGPAGTLTTRLAIRVNAAGREVGYDARAGLSLDATPIPTPPRGATLPIDGGGALTHWGRGYFSVDSAAGDTVSLFDRGGHLEYCARLAGETA